MNLYLAGPFFNAEQRHLITRIRDVLAAQDGCHVFSPMHDGPNVSKGGDPDLAFEANVRCLDEADIVLAVMDYVLPVDCKLRVVRPGKAVREDVVHAVSPPLALPDTGTVWELGYAYATNTQLVGYTENARNRINVMLAKCLAGWVCGMNSLATWAEHGFVDSYLDEHYGGLY